MNTVASVENRSKHPGAAAVFAWGAVAAAAARAVAGILDSPSHTFAESRLMPLFQAARGLSPYVEPSGGPWYVPMYPPLSFLAYAPALLAERPVAALRIAAAVCEICVIVPVVLLVLSSRRSSAPRLLAASAAAALLCWLHVSPVLTALFFVHADAPAILFAGLGAWLLVRGIRQDRPALLAASVAVLSLAPWAKQTFLPVVLLPTVVLWPSSRRRALLCLLGSAAAAAIWAALFGVLFGAPALAFWTVEFSARHAWIGPPLEALANSNRFLVAEGLALLLVAAALAWRERAAAENRGPVSTSPAAVLLVAALLLWPGSVIGYVKVGGAVNSFIPTLFFLSCAAAIALLEGAGGAGPVRAALVAAGLVLTAQSAADAAVAVRHALRGTWDADFAYETVRRDPSHVFLPWFPLSTHLATGAFFHTELGIAERELAGLPLDGREWERFLPRDVRFVLCGKDPCPATLGRFQVTASREVRRGETTWTAHEIRRK